MDTQLADMATSTGPLADRQLEIDQLRDSLTRARDNYDLINQQVEDRGAEKSALQKRVEGLLRSAERKETKIEILERQMDRMAASLERRDVSAAEQEKVIGDQMATAEEYKRRTADLYRRVIELEAKEAELQEENAALFSEGDRARRDANVRGKLLQEREKELKTAHRGLEQGAVREAQTTGEIRRHLENIGRLENLAAERQRQFQVLAVGTERRINELQVALETERRRADDAPSRGEFAAARQREALLQQRIQELQEEIGNVRQIQEQNRDLGETLSRARTQQRTDAYVMEQFRAENERLQRELPALQEALRQSRIEGDRAIRRPATATSGTQASLARSLNPASPAFEPAQKRPSGGPVSRSKTNVENIGTLKRGKEAAAGESPASRRQPEESAAPAQRDFPTLGEYARQNGTSAEQIARLDGELRTKGKTLGNIRDQWRAQHRRNPQRFRSADLDAALRDFIRGREQRDDVRIGGPRNVSYASLAAYMAQEGISVDSLFDISPLAPRRAPPRMDVESPAFVPSGARGGPAQEMSPIAPRSALQSSRSRSPGARVRGPGGVRAEAARIDSSARKKLELKGPPGRVPKRRDEGNGRWTDYGGPNFAASTAKVYKQISRGGARKPRRPKSAPGFMDYEDECNDPNETGMGYSGGKSEMMTTENKHAYMDKNWAGLPKVWSIGKGVKLRNAHYKPKERY